MTERGQIIEATMRPSLAELKAHLHITSNAQDPQLGLYLRAALLRAGAYIGKTIAQTSFTYTGAFQTLLSLPQVLSITSVKVDGVTIASSSYSLSDGVLALEGTVTGEKMEVAYVAGMANPAESILAAVLLIAADLFLHRENPVKSLPSQAEWLLDPYRTWGYGR